MQSLVGIYRASDDLEEALARIADLRRRVADVAVEGPKPFNPGWDLVFELRNMLIVAEAVTRSAGLRTESRGAHSRLDHPSLDPAWERLNVVVCPGGPEMHIETAPTVPLADALRTLITSM